MKALQMATLTWQSACAVSRDRVVGVTRNHIFVISDPNLPVHCIIFYGTTMTINGSLHGTSLIVKRFSAEIFSKSRQKLAQNGGFRD